MSADQESEGLASDEREGFGETEEDLGVLDWQLTSEAIVVSTDWTAETILNQIQRKHLELTPHFQRRDAWDRRKKSRFVESLIVGLPIPQIVLAERRGRRGDYVVLDGKQRLLSLQQFTDASGGFKLIGLDLRKDLNGLSYQGLPDKDRLALDTQTIRTIVVRNWQYEEFLYVVFLRLNTESVSLSPQELRQALNPGKFVNFVNDFTADNSEFYSLFRRDKPDFRMRDVELLVRYFAFRYFLPDYVGNLKPLLDTTCDRLNKDWAQSEQMIREEATACQRAISAITQIFGEEAFRRWNGRFFERPFNRAVFDVMTFYAREPRVREAMFALSEEVIASFKAVCEQAPFAEAITTTTKSREAILTRLRMWGQRLEGVTELSLPIPSLGPGGRIAYA